MIDQLRSELLKLRTTPTLAVLLLAAVGLSVLGACLEGFSPTRRDWPRRTRSACHSAPGAAARLSSRRSPD